MTNTGYKSAYAEKLKDPRWQKKRLIIFKRDQWKCRSCSDDKSPLHIHHLVYVKGKEPWDYPRRSLLTVCYKCHNLAHSGKILSINPNPRSSREMGTNPRKLRGKNG